MDVFECIKSRVRKELQGVYKAYRIVHGDYQMNPLDLLKTQLQNALNESTEHESFNDALTEALYACELSVVALEEWVHHWVSWKCENEVNRNDDYEYLQGVKFVEDRWHQIR